MSLTDCPCGHSRIGNMAYRYSSKIVSAGSYAASVSNGLTRHGRTLNQGAWTSNWKWAKLSILPKLILTQAMLGDTPVYRDNAKWPLKTVAFSASICATSFHISEVRCLAFDTNPCCFVHYDHDNYDDGWSRQCPSCIQGMKIRIRSSRTLESFAGWGKETSSKNCRRLGAVWRLFAPHLRDPSNHRSYSLA